MGYLSKVRDDPFEVQGYSLVPVIDETLRLITFSFVVFREAKADVNLSGYTIPKGWKILVWFRSIHLDPEIYHEPKEFNPSRWDILVQLFEPETFVNNYLLFNGSQQTPSTYDIHRDGHLVFAPPGHA
ncbi:hypothetical protein RJ639_006614 [Escallonia herrerae]|uniref:Uncharacterized protein n=1 Tax=Escallonia herrerae TaxID=1293975 RepID=A0AA89ASW2_9ASTE|nr:hypothetical protein RJ639_006614 [Escallonia herrerae]